MCLIHADIDTLFRKATNDTFIQFFRYIFVGGFAFAVDAFILWLCEHWMNYLIAAAIAFVAGLIANYILSTHFVFSQSKDVPSKTLEFITYGIIGIIGLLLTELLMYVFTDLCGLYFLASKIIAAAIVLIWNFAARKVILYTERK